MRVASDRASLFGRKKYVQAHGRDQMQVTVSGRNAAHCKLHLRESSSGSRRRVSPIEALLTHAVTWGKSQPAQLSGIPTPDASLDIHWHPCARERRSAEREGESLWYSTQVRANEYTLSSMPEYKISAAGVLCTTRQHTRQSKCISTQASLLSISGQFTTVCIFETYLDPC